MDRKRKKLLLQNNQIVEKILLLANQNMIRSTDRHERKEIILSMPELKILVLSKSKGKHHVKEDRQAKKTMCRSKIFVLVKVKRKAHGLNQLKSHRILKLEI